MPLLGMNDYSAKYTRIAKLELSYIANRENLLEVDKEYYELLEYIKDFRETPLLPDARHLVEEVDKQASFYKYCLAQVETRCTSSSGYKKESWESIRSILQQRLDVLENIEPTLH